MPFFMKMTAFDIEDIRTTSTCCLNLFEQYRTENSHHCDLLSQWSMEQTPVCIECLENIGTHSTHRQKHNNDKNRI